MVLSMRLPEYLVEVQPADAADGSIGDRAAISSHLSGYASARWGRVSAAVQSAVVAAGTERTSTCAVTPGCKDSAATCQ